MIVLFAPVFGKQIVTSTLEAMPGKRCRSTFSKSSTTMHTDATWVRSALLSPNCPTPVHIKGMIIRMVCSSCVNCLSSSCVGGGIGDALPCCWSFGGGVPSEVCALAGWRQGDCCKCKESVAQVQRSEGWRQKQATRTARRLLEPRPHRHEFGHVRFTLAHAGLPFSSGFPQSSS